MKKKPAPRKPTRRAKRDILPIIVRTLRAIKEVYPGDRSAPGMVTSVLDSGQFYTSIVRYDQEFGGGKKVVVSAEEATLEAAITTCVSRWMAGTVNVRALRHEIEEIGEPIDGQWDEVDD